MNEQIQQLVRQSNIRRSWTGLVSSVQEIEAAKQTIADCESRISTFDRINVFTDTPEEAQVKDAKQRIKSREDDLKNFHQEVGAFLQSMAEKVEGFAFALKLESVLTRTLAASQPKEFKSLGKELSAWLVECEPEDNHEGLLKGSGRTALERLGGGMLETRRALWALQAPFRLVAKGHEVRWGEKQRILTFRPLILALVEDCYEAFHRDAPGLALPCDIFRTMQFQEELVEELNPSQEALKESVNSLLQEQLPNLRQTCRELGSLQSLLALNKARISTLDRVVFWSDTDAEALEKTLKKERKELSSQLEAQWDTLCVQNRLKRAAIWGAMLLDVGSHIQPLVNGIYATDPKGVFTKTCEVANREEPALEVDTFRRTVVQRYPLQTDAEVLKRRAKNHPVEGVPVRGRPHPNPAALSEAEVVSVLAAQLSVTDFQESLDTAQQLDSDMKEAREKSREEFQGKSFFGKVASLATTVSKDYREAYQAQQRSENLKWEAENTFWRAMNRAHSPTAIGLLLNQLGSDIAAISAYVAESRTTDSEGNERVEYYGALHGKGTAMERANLLNEMIADQAAGLGFPLESLEQHLSGKALELIAAQPFRF